jgi:hypothetical protein
LPARLTVELLEARTVPSAPSDPSGLISAWTADGTTADALGINNGALQGGAGYAPGVVRDAFRFNGQDGYFRSPTNLLPTGSQDRTLDLWVKIDAFVAQEAFFGGYGAFGSFNQTYHLGASGSTLFFSQWGNAVFGPSLSTGTWYNVAVTNVGSAVTLYLNGQAVATGNLTIDTPADAPFYMGRIPGGLGDIRRLDGEVDEIAVFDRALSPGEIMDVYLGALARGSTAASVTTTTTTADLTSLVSASLALTTPQVTLGGMSGVLAYVRSGGGNTSHSPALGTGMFDPAGEAALSGTASPFSAGGSGSATADALAGNVDVLFGGMAWLAVPGDVLAV